MELRGTRECSDCGERWSYYETGDITCPACGSMRSVGVDDRTLHTTSPATLDLTSVRDKVDTASVRELATEAADRCREYCRSVGFVHAGELQPLDDGYLAALELRRVGTALSSALDVSDEEEAYLLQLLQTADKNERPVPTDVPDSLRAERGLAIAAGVDAYLTDLRRVVEDREPAVDSVLSTVTAHRKRIEALDGDLPPAETERLVSAVHDLSTYLTDGDETALARATERLD
ncbi:DUF7117 family protein [Halovenus marina]|uniref:DUF7117 family protein n=1 Tax=Halovenus marina TaxID=3396621 RepID=UPI003F54BB83